MQASSCFDGYEAMHASSFKDVSRTDNWVCQKHKHAGHKPTAKTELEEAMQRFTFGICVCCTGENFFCGNSGGPLHRKSRCKPARSWTMEKQCMRPLLKRSHEPTTGSGKSIILVDTSLLRIQNVMKQN